MSYALHMLIAIDFSFNTGNLALKYHNKINSKQGKLGGRGGGGLYLGLGGGIVTGWNFSCTGI